MSYIFLLLEIRKNDVEMKFMLLFKNDFPEKAASRCRQNEDFFVKMFPESKMVKQRMAIISSVLYGRLKKCDK